MVASHTQTTSVTEKLNVASGQSGIEYKAEHVENLSRDANLDLPGQIQVGTALHDYTMASAVAVRDHCSREAKVTGLALHDIYSTMFNTIDVKAPQLCFNISYSAPAQLDQHLLPHVFLRKASTLKSPLP